MDDLEELRRLWMVAPHERLHQEAAGALCRSECPLGFGRVAGERFLAEHVLPRLERANRPFDVRSVRQRDIHSLEVAVREERFVAPVRTRNRLLVCVRVRPILPPARYGDEVRAWRLTQCRDDGPVD